MKVATVVGARPQFVKAAVVSRALRNSGADESIIHTGQHYDDQMSRIFFEELEIPDPVVNLGVGSGTQAWQTAAIMERIEPELCHGAFDWVLAFGDTNSTLAVALAAAKLHLNSAHIEAGLRSFNRRMPEEINRVVTDHVCEQLFAPTDAAVRNLLREGVSGERIHLVGDVMNDAALYYGSKAMEESRILEQLHLTPREYVLATVHRAENTDDLRRLRNIYEGLIEVSSAHAVIWPVHPRTRQALQHQCYFGVESPRVRLMEPVGYLDMIMLERNAAVIATDSGGIQKEAFFYGIPCVTLRDETEWVELVELGWNRLAPPEDAHSVAAAIEAAAHAQCRRVSSPYGDGRSSEHIVEVLSQINELQLQVN
jgi:UDP-GlcNAc3NAcA epimerase